MIKEEGYSYSGGTVFQAENRKVRVSCVDVQKDGRALYQTSIINVYIGVNCCLCIIGDEVVHEQVRYILNSVHTESGKVDRLIALAFKTLMDTEPLRVFELFEEVHNDGIKEGKALQQILFRQALGLAGRD